jgi:hypothetical protein
VGSAAGYQHQIVARVMDHYGRQCACCGTTSRLSIDHVNGGGGRHRRELGVATTYGFCLWLIRQNFPPGFQILCQQCNSSKGEGPRCRLHSRSAGPMTKAPKEGYANITEASEYLGVKVRTLQRWAERGYGPEQKRIGVGRGRPRYQWADLRVFKGELTGVPP